MDGRMASKAGCPAATSWAAKDPFLQPDHCPLSLTSLQTHTHAARLTAPPPPPPHTPLPSASRLHNLSNVATPPPPCLPFLWGRKKEG